MTQLPTVLVKNKTKQKHAPYDFQEEGKKKKKNSTFGFCYLYFLYKKSCLSLNALYRIWLGHADSFETPKTMHSAIKMVVLSKHIM